MTIQEVLLSIVSYPVPVSAIANIADARELVLGDDISKEIRSSDNFRLAEADLLMWVSFAPNIQEGGVNISMLYSDRKEMRDKANSIYNELNDIKQKPSIRQIYIYEGEDI